MSDLVGAVKKSKMIKLLWSSTFGFRVLKLAAPIQEFRKVMRGVGSAPAAQHPLAS